VRGGRWEKRGWKVEGGGLRVEDGDEGMWRVWEGEMIEGGG